MQRRKYLASTVGVAALLPLAGCSGSGASDDGGSGTETSSTEGMETEDGDGGSTAESPSTRTEEEVRIHEDYETTEVRVTSPDGTELGTVTAAIADTYELRYLGLSDTEVLPPDRGMLFVYDSVDDHTFVMREMDFGIDIVYADADGAITTIHHAPAPAPDEDGNDQRYPGRGQYVLEVNLDWTTEHDVSEGDVLEFDIEG